MVFRRFHLLIVSVLCSLVLAACDINWSMGLDSATPVNEVPAGDASTEDERTDADGDVPARPRDGHDEVSATPESGTRGDASDVNVGPVEPDQANDSAGPSPDRVDEDEDSDGLGSDERTVEVPTTAEYNDKPDGVSTGPATSLKRVSGDRVVREDGATIESLDIHGCVTVDADNVTIRNVRISCNGNHGIRFHNDARGGRVEAAAIDGRQAAKAGISGGDGIVVRDTEIHSAADGVKVGTRSTYAHNWIHSLARSSDSHNDGFQMMAGANVKIVGNAVDHVPGPTSSIIIKTDAGPISDVEVSGNWLSGGAFTVYVVEASNRPYGLPLNVRIVDNKFVNNARFGPLRVEGSVELSGNVWAETGELIR